MARRLNNEDIDRLLSDYRSEKRKLTFQLDQVRAAMKDLKKLRIEKENIAAEKSTTRKSYYKKKRGRRKKRTVVEGYKLNDWDQMVVDYITNENMLRTKAQILKTTKAWARKNHPRMKAAEVEGKLTRVLQKLAGKRGVLGGHRTGLQRGYHYGIKEWFFESSGKLMKIHFDKIELPKVKK